MYRIGVDIGGTFTDFALFDARGAKMSVHKRLTTPHDPSEAVTEGIDALLKRESVAIADVSDVVHGTTLVTNAVIERRGAVTGMLATAGFSDILDMGFERRYDLFDLRVKYPPPLVPRRLRLEVAERVRFDGSVETAARRGRRAGRRASASRSSVSPRSPSASCMPTPTRRTRRAPPRSCARPRRTYSCPPRPTCSPTCASSSAGRRPPSTPSRSRCSTATSSGWRRAWPSQGFRGRLYIMSSSGGTLTADTARRFPVRALEVGPGRRRADERLSRPQPRSAEPALLRHGRHHGQGRAGARRQRPSSATAWKWRACTSSGRAAASPSASRPST